MPPIRLQIDLALHEVARGEYTALALQDHSSPHWIVSHVLRGRVLARTHGEQEWAVGGDVMVHPPHVPFSETADVPGLHQYMIFDLSQPPGLDVLHLTPVSLVVHLSDADAFTRTHDSLRQAWTRPPGVGRDLKALSLTLGMMTMLADDWRRSGRPPRPVSAQTSRQRFLDLIAYMKQNLDQRITREDLAARAFLHPGYFDRAFHKAHGIAPLRMLREMRLTRARELLETTEDPLEAIAAACGLGDAPAFSRAFRARYGLPPGRHRDSAQAARLSYPLP